MNNTSPFHRWPGMPGSLTRREFLWRSGGGLGGIALASLLGGEGLLADNMQEVNSGDLRRPTLPHFAPKAKRVVQLFMAQMAP